MKKLIQLPVVALLCAGASLAIAQTPAKYDQPVYAAGDSWTYRSLDGWNNSETGKSKAEFLQTDGDQHVMRSTNLATNSRNNFRVNKDLQFCRNMRNSEQVVCAGALRFPLTPDHKHSYSNLPWGNNATGHLRADCSGKGEEKVTVPAGTFDAIRIECNGFWTRVFEGSGVGAYKEVFWYAPSVKNLVKINIENRYADGRIDTKIIRELIEHTVKN